MSRLSRSRGSRRLLQRRQVQVLLVLVISALVLSAGFLLGQKAAYSGLELGPEEQRALREALPAAEDKVRELEAALEVEKTHHAIDSEALELVRREIAQQKEQIASLEEGIRFYRGLMAPEEIAQGLSIRVPELVERELASQFAFRIVAQQEARKHELLKGELYVEVYGDLEGQRVSYPLSELSEDVEAGTVALRFRYFQAIEGELNLPAGFSPEGISVVATASSPQKVEVRERFPWLIQERFTHVGK